MFRQSERYHINVVYRASPAVVLSDSSMRVPRSPPYMSVLEGCPPLLFNNLSAFVSLRVFV